MIAMFSLADDICCKCCRPYWFALEREKEEKIKNAKFGTYEWYRINQIAWPAFCECKDK